MSKTPNLRIWRIRDYAYFADIFLVYGSNDQIRTWLRRKDSNAPWINATSGRWMCISKDGFETHYIIVSTRSGPVWTIAVLTHELMHMTLTILQDRGIKYCDASEEAFAYYQQYMMAECLKRLRIHLGVWK